MTGYVPTEHARLLAEILEDDARLPKAPWTDWPGLQGRPSFPRVRAPYAGGGTEPVLTIDSWDGISTDVAIAVCRIRNNLGAVADQLEVGAKEIARLKEANSGLEIERDTYRAMICDLLASAYPHPVEHPTMTKQWNRARALLKDGP